MKKQTFIRIHKNGTKYAALTERGTWSVAQQRRGSRLQRFESNSCPSECHEVFLIKPEDVNWFFPGLSDDLVLTELAL